MKKQVKIILAAIIIAGAAIGGYFYTAMPLEAGAMEIIPETANMYFIQQGQGVKGGAVTVYPLADGQVLSIHVAEGDMVQKGDIICLIDSFDYELLLAQSESTIKAYAAQKRDLSLSESKERNSLAATREDLQAQLAALSARSESKNLSIQEQLSLQESINRQMEISLAWAKDNFEKAEQLYNGEAIARQDYEDAEKAYLDAEKALEQGVIQLATIASSTDSTVGSDEYFAAMENSLAAQISGIDRNLQSSYTGALSDYYQALMESEEVHMAQLRKKIENCTVKAPISGKIEKLYVKDSNVAVSSMPAAYIVPEKNIDVEVYILTKDIVNVSLGDPAEVIFKGRDVDISMTAKVTAIDDKAEEQLSPLGVAEKKVKVTLEMESNDIIKDGYDVDVKFTYYHEENQVILPKNAVFQHEGKDYVWLVNDDAAFMQEISKGIELRGDLVIDSGLEFGDIVIKDANNNKIKEGAALKAVY